MSTAAEELLDPLDDVERVILGFGVDPESASNEARLALFMHEAMENAALVADELLAGERARDMLVQRAAELRTGLDVTEVERILAAYLKAVTSTVELPRIDLNDESTWGAWIGALAEAGADARRSGSFISIMMTQVSIARLAELCPAGAPWQSLVLAVQELQELKKLPSELEKAQLTIRQLRARLAEADES